MEKARKTEAYALAAKAKEKFDDPERQSMTSRREEPESNVSEAHLFLLSALVRRFIRVLMRLVSGCRGVVGTSHVRWLRD